MLASLYAALSVGFLWIPAIAVALWRWTPVQPSAGLVLALAFLSSAVGAALLDVLVHRVSSAFGEEDRDRYRKEARRSIFPLGTLGPALVVFEMVKRLETTQAEGEQ